MSIKSAPVFFFPLFLHAQPPQDRV
jgi:hypothetical protein